MASDPFSKKEILMTKQLFGIFSWMMLIALLISGRQSA
jgi:hypothetical protein